LPTSYEAVRLMDCPEAPLKTPDQIATPISKHDNSLPTHRIPDQACRASRPVFGSEFSPVSRRAARTPRSARIARNRSGSNADSGGATPWAWTSPLAARRPATTRGAVSRLARWSTMPYVSVLALPAYRPATSTRSADHPDARVAEGPRAAAAERVSAPRLGRAARAAPGAREVRVAALASEAADPPSM